jgi:hypothetical protein
VISSRYLGCTLFALLLTGCGAINYVPSEYEITTDRIQKFDISGTVTVENNQPDTTKTIVLSAPARDWVSDNHTVTEHLAAQLRRELAKHGNIINKTSDKSIGVKVTKQQANMYAFHMTGSLEVWITLGVAESFPINIDQGSPGNVWRVLNGNIALGVIEILSDKRVLAYLAL